MSYFKQQAEQLKTNIPTLFLALKKKETPILAKVMAGLTVAYFLSPLDLIPDFIPVLGYLDDLIILPLLVIVTVKLIPAEVFQACRQESEELWADGKPKKWYYAVPIAAVWIVVLLLLLKIVVD